MMVLSMNFQAYSQRKALNSKGDTVICFSQSQSKFLLKQNYKVKELTELNTVCESQKSYCDSLRTCDSLLLVALKKNIVNSAAIEAERQKQVDGLNTRHQKDVRKIRLYKYTLVASNVVTFVITLIILK